MTGSSSNRFPAHLQAEDLLHPGAVHPCGGARVPRPAAAADPSRAGGRRPRQSRTAPPSIAGPTPGSRACSIGLSIRSSLSARVPSPRRARAMASHTAAWVYWPPFSRTPGGYAWMYPGEGCALSNGGVNSSASPSFSSTSWDHADSSAVCARSRVGAAAQGRPRLRKGIDSRLGVRRGAQERAVIENRPNVPVAVPGSPLDSSDQRFPLVEVFARSNPPCPAPRTFPTSP